MRVILVTMVSVIFWLGAGRASAQQIKSPAEWVPARALAYVELRQPGALFKELAALLEGSYWSDVPYSLAPLHAKAPPALGRRADRITWVGLIPGLIASPEMVREVGRVEGAALAITGLDKEERNMPEFIVIVRPGDSNLPGLLMRGFLMAFAYGRASSDGKTRTETRAGFETVAKVEGVAIQRMVERSFKWTEGDRAPGKPQVRITGPALARLPDTLLVGSSTLVEDTIRRIKGKGNGATLASTEIFQQARRDAGSRPGLFAFANPAAVLEMLERADLARGKRQLIEVVKTVINPAAIRAVADQLSLENGTLSYRRLLYLDPKEKSPVLEILPAQAVPERLMHFVSPDAIAFAAVANDSGEKRWQRLLELADSIAKQVGDAQPELKSAGRPSQLAGKLEAALGIELGKEANKIRGAAIAVPGLQEFLKGDSGRQPPYLLLVDATDEKTASNLAREIFPKVFGLLAGEPDLKPGQRTLDGHTLGVLQGKRDYALYVGREGSTLVIGPSPHVVARSLTRGQKQQGLLSDDKLARRLGNLKEAVAVALVRPITVAGFFWIRSDGPPPAAIEAEPTPGPAPAPKRPVQRPGAAAKDLPREARAFIELLKNEQPLVVGITRTPDHIAVDASYPGMRPLVARVINFVLEATLHDSGRGSSPAPIEKALPSRPTPPR